MENIFEEYDYNGYYMCSPDITATKFSKLMYLLSNIDILMSKLSISENEIKQLILKYLNTHKEEVNICNELGWSPIHLVARNSRRLNLTDILIPLIECGADVNSQNTDWTPLMMACCFIEDSNYETVSLLLKYGANANLQNINGFTALMLACSKGDYMVVKMLVDYGADVNIQNNFGLTALLIACKNSTKMMEIVKILLDHGANVNLQDNNGYTPLMICCANNSCDSNETVKLLLEYGSDVNIQCKNKWSALMIACRHYSMINNGKNIELLLEYGSDTNLQDIRGLTPLMIICQTSYGNVNKCKIIEMILNNGANINLKDIDGFTALMMACKFGCNNHEVINLLLKRGADVNLQNVNGITSLSIACYYKRDINIILTLLDYGTDYLTINRFGKTQLHYIVKYVTDVYRLKKIINRICEIRHYRVCMDKIIKEFHQDSIADTI